MEVQLVTYHSAFTNHCNLFVFLSPVPSGPPFVSLDASPKSVGGGDSINVTCTVLGEPEVDVSFTWFYPGQVSKEWGDRI